MLLKNLLRFALLMCIVQSTYTAQAQDTLTVDQLPNPQTTSNTYVSNPNGVLTSLETDSLNSLMAGMRSQLGVEAAVVVLNDFDPHLDDFTFATKLFRKWGIGGAHSNNGLLLLVATGRKKYRFITGYGLEGNLPDGVLSTIGTQYLVPAFQQQQYGHGVIKAMQVINDYFSQPNNRKDLQALLAKDKVENADWRQPVAIMVALLIACVLILRHLKARTPAASKNLLTKTSNTYNKTLIYFIVGVFFSCFVAVFILAFTIRFSWIKEITWTGIAVIVYVIINLVIFLRYLNTLSIIRKLHPDDLHNSEATVALQKSTWWYIVFSPFVFILMLLQAISRQRNKHRFAPHTDDKGNAMTRVDRDINIDGKPYLTAGQYAEEKQGVYHYDIWLGNTADNFKVISNEGANFSSFEKCEKCGFKTLAKPTTVPVIKATYTHAGEGKKVRICAFCQHEDLIKMIVLPMLTHSSDSSSSSSSSGGGSSSSSSDSGSYGGGSTGGGGAGGSW